MRLSQATSYRCRVEDNDGETDTDDTGLGLGIAQTSINVQYNLTQYTLRLEFGMPNKSVVMAYGDQTTAPGCS